MMTIKTLIGPEMLVFEVLGQVHFRFWLVDCYLVLCRHLHGLYNIHVICNWHILMCVFVNGNHRDNVDIFSFQFLLTHRTFPMDQNLLENITLAILLENCKVCHQDRRKSLMYLMQTVIWWLLMGSPSTRGLNSSCSL